MSLSLDAIISLSKRRGFIFQSSEIYGGLGATYDYGPLGVMLKRNVIDAWWRAMTQMHDNIVGLDAAILMHPTVWKASGHVDAFHDPMIDDKVSKRRYRADQLVEEHIVRLEKKGKVEQAKRVHDRLVEVLNSKDVTGGLHEIIMEEEIHAPESGAFDWTEVRQFNLMFTTKLGALSEGDNEVYLRPETAQGIFVNFHNVRETARLQIPFGIAQVGKAFRNEIIARQFVFRMREFEQMEMQYFIAPGMQRDAFDEWREKRMQWHIDNGVRADKLRFHEHEQLAHYADAAVDVQYEFPMGWQEVEGVHSRTDYDLRRHQEYSGKKMEYFDPQSRERYIPFVVETSVGLDRTVMMLLCDAYREEEVKGEQRVVLKFHPRIAPITVAVLPLVRKEGMPETARAIERELRDTYRTFYDEKGAVGRRYRRMDEVGTPFAVTIDGQTQEDGTVTLRERDSMDQVRVSKDRLKSAIRDKMAGWEG